LITEKFHVESIFCFKDMLEQRLSLTMLSAERVPVL